MKFEIYNVDGKNFVLDINVMLYNMFCLNNDYDPFKASGTYAFKKYIIKQLEIINDRKLDDYEKSIYIECRIIELIADEAFLKEYNEFISNKLGNTRADKA